MRDLTNDVIHSLKHSGSFSAPTTLSVATTNSRGLPSIVETSLSKYLELWIYL